jgi:hypothetical protein
LKKQLAKLKAENEKGVEDKHPVHRAPRSSSALEPSAAGEGGGGGEKSGCKEVFDGSGGGRKDGAEVGRETPPGVGREDVCRDRLRERRERLPPTHDMMVQSVRKFGAMLAPGGSPPSNSSLPLLVSSSALPRPGPLFLPFPQLLRRADAHTQQRYVG